MPSIQTENPLLQLLIETRPAGAACVDIWNDAVTQPMFVSDLANAFSSAGRDIDVVLEYASRALESSSAAKVDNVLRVFDVAISRFDLSDGASAIDHPQAWVSFMHQYAARTGADSIQGRVALQRLEAIVRRAVFEHREDFFSVADVLAARAGGTGKLDEITAGIWKDLLASGLARHCVDSPDLPIGARYMKECGNAYPMRRDRILDYAGRYLDSKGAIGEAAREVVAAGAKPAIPASQPAVPAAATSPSGAA